MPATTIAILLICAAAVAGVVVRPWRMAEAVWAVGGAALLLGCGLVTPGAAWRAIGEGGDVYLFLIGMMLLSEAARARGLFDWAAAWAVRHARGSPRRLLALVFGVGVIVTAFLSNDATAVVLTPAVYAAARRGKVDPLPHLFACAFVANAASFVLPISNPANLVLYAGHLPPLRTWLAAFALPSLAAILVTFLLLRHAERARLGGGRARDIPPPSLSTPGRIALAGIVATAAILLASSALGIPLGWPTCLAGIATAAIVQTGARRSPLPLLRAIDWQILPLVAGLFVLVEAIASTGLIGAMAAVLARAAAAAPATTAGIAGGLVAFAGNLVNNLPAGLVAAQLARAAHSPAVVTDALLIGVDLGPNLSITGSLATILWLAAIRREGEDVSFRRFLRVGAMVTPPAVTAALLARILIG